MITANALICGKKIQLIVIKIMSLGYIQFDGGKTFQLGDFLTNGVLIPSVYR
ncbi:hypothetical protein [Symbiopectobacterium sp. RP]|uniref:hypothetical protein n=1 Tax=Symbiopectobacterium sp. RP TaxID=3248553 RepID=UPI003D2CEB3D